VALQIQAAEVVADRFLHSKAAAQAALVLSSSLTQTYTLHQ
jgi:hypothetical protein